MPKSPKEVADTLEELTETIEEQKREKEAARLERKRKREDKARRKRIEQLIAPVLFIALLIISAVVMFISQLF